MTALSQYARLECEALWRAAPGTQRRAVIVLFGDATLTICDRNEAPLAHWSLPAVQRLNPGQNPALYAPDREGSETLELDEPAMIEAIETVRRALRRRRGARGRLRLALGAGTLGAIVLAATLWLPGALLSYTADVVPAPQRAAIGRALLDAMAAEAGPPCGEGQARTALRRLRQRVMGDTGRLVVLPGGLAAPSQHLPGDIIVLARASIEGADGPERAAALVLVERIEAAHGAPLARLLREAGPLVALRLLTTGTLPPEVIAAHARTLLDAPDDPPALTEVAAALEAAGIPLAPYAYGRDPSGESVLKAVAADRFGNGAMPRLMSDGDWVALSGICKE